VIVEVHLTLLEEAENDEHLEACRDMSCGHRAHLFKVVAERYAGVVEVFELVTESKTDYEKRLRDNMERRREEAPYVAQRKQEAKSLAVIRRGWDRLYDADEAR
jgi:hypothetical protein